MDAKFCNKCGSPVEALGDSMVEYFSIPPKRLALFSILTLGVYEIYWFYKNWQAVKKFERQKISPLGRAFFVVFYCNSLFKKILKSAKSHGYQGSYSPGWLATVYILLLFVGNGLSKVESSDVGLNLVWLVVAISSFIPLLFVQKAINFNNEKIKGDADLKRGFSGGEVILIIVGLIWFFFTLWGSFLTPEPEYGSDSDNSPQIQTEVLDEQTPEDVLRQADYQEGYKAGYADGRALQGQLLDSYGPPATEERRMAYVQGYLDGFLKGCREGDFDCSEIERAINEAIENSVPDAQLAPAEGI